MYSPTRRNTVNKKVFHFVAAMGLSLYTGHLMSGSGILKKSDFSEYEGCQISGYGTCRFKDFPMYVGSRCVAYTLTGTENIGTGANPKVTTGLIPGWVYLGSGQYANGWRTFAYEALFSGLGAAAGLGVEILEPGSTGTYRVLGSSASYSTSRRGIYDSFIDMSYEFKVVAANPRQIGLNRCTPPPSIRPTNPVDPSANAGCGSPGAGVAAAGVGSIGTRGDPIELPSGRFYWRTECPATSNVAAGIPARISLNFAAGLRVDPIRDGMPDGWMRSYSRRIEEVSNEGSVVFTSDDGNEYVFHIGTGTDFPNGYRPPSGSSLRLTKLSTEFELSYRDGVRDYFNVVTGEFSRQVDRFGNQLSLSNYSAAGVRELTSRFNTGAALSAGETIELVHDCPSNTCSTDASKWRLISVRDKLVSGRTGMRTMSIGYNANNQISQIADAGGRVYKFGYDDFGRMS
jgi:hypothetical protein